MHHVFASCPIGKLGYWVLLVRIRRVQYLQYSYRRVLDHKRTSKALEILRLPVLRAEGGHNYWRWVTKTFVTFTTTRRTGVVPWSEDLSCLGVVDILSNKRAALLTGYARPKLTRTWWWLLQGVWANRQPHTTLLPRRSKPGPQSRHSAHDRVVRHKYIEYVRLP